MKKILSVLLAVLMLIGAMPLSALAVAFNDGTLQWVDADTATFVAGHVVADAGDTVTVPVAIQNNPGIISFKLQIGYDDTALELVEATQTLYTSAVMGPLTKNPLIINWCEGDRTEDCTDEGQFLLLTFAVKDAAAAGSYPITLSYAQEDVFNYDFEDVPFATLAGSVTVTAPQAIPRIYGVLNKTNVERGENLILSVVMENNPGLIGWLVDVEFDESALQLVNYAGGDVFSSVSFGTNKKGYVNALWFDFLADENYTNDSVLFLLEFQVKESAKNGETALRIYCSDEDNICNIDYEPVFFAFEDAAVTITGCEHAYDHGCDNTCNLCGYVRDTAHDLVWEVMEQPTCDEPGYGIWTCSACGYSYEETIDRTGMHTYEIEIIPPTCEEYGYTDHTCTVCGDWYETDWVDPLGHTYVTEVFPPTCENEGCTEYTCTVCGDWYEADWVPALPHDYEVEVVPPTCDEEGYTDHVCTVCGHWYETDRVPALGHTYETEVYPPTCDEEGYTDYTCIICGDWYEADWVPTIPHDYEVEVVPPTCDEEGYTEYSCMNCDDWYKTDWVPALGHTYDHEYDSECNVCGQWRDVECGHSNRKYEEKRATCTMNGMWWEYCADCGEMMASGVLPAPGHTPGAPADCVNDQTCTVCGVVLNTAIGHTYTAAVTAPNCVSGGYTTYTCTICGDSYISDKTPALGHAYNGEVTTAPTCVDTGVKTYVCSVCGHSYTEIIPATGKHTYKGVVTAPTCTAGGYTTYTCSVCGIHYVADRTPALGHTYASAITRPATCGAQGIRTYTCRNCGVYYTETIPATGEHTYDYACDNSCNGCGALRETTGHVGGADGVCVVCGTRLDWGEDAVIYVSTDTYTVDPGFAFTVDVMMQNNPGLLGWQILLDYDSDILEIVDVASAATFSGIAFGPTHKNPLSALWVDAIHGNNGNNGTMYTVTFRVKADAALGDTTIITYCSDPDNIYNTNYETVPFQYIGVSVTVTDHNYNSEVTAPTCETDGYTTYTCTICGDVYVEDRVPAPGHTPGAPADCVNDQVCTVCGIVLNTAIGHNYESVVTAPTCEEDGYTTYTCAVCGDSYIADKVAALGHKYDRVLITAPTCVTNGLVTETCLVCGHSYDEIIPAGPWGNHNYAAVVTAPTCEADGYTTYTCSDCGDSYIADEVAALGHTYEKEVVPPTCVSDGYNAYRCARCGDTYTETIPATGKHTYKGVVTAPTCEADGYTTYTCTMCGGSYIADKTLAPGHTLGAPADCINDQTCTVCGAVLQKAAHVYVSVCDRDCNVCGETRTPPHLYDNACDAECNLCGALRRVGDHVYDNACDVTCNECGAVREVEPHIYDTTCDTTCNICGAVRSIIHTYDHACDADCNVCGVVRVPADHLYDNACDTACNHCGFLRVPAEHIYDFACDAFCNICGAQRETEPHAYTDLCDRDCNVCGEVRVPPHLYDNACDDECNACGEVRVPSDHAYTNAADDTCNACGFVRELHYLSENGEYYDGYENGLGSGQFAFVPSKSGTYRIEIDNVDYPMGFVPISIYDVDGNAIPYEDHSYQEGSGNFRPAYTIILFDVTAGEKYAIYIGSWLCYIDVEYLCDHIYDNACDAQCDICGETREVAPHTYNAEVTTEPTCAMDGVRTYTCIACDDRFTETIPATGDHTYTTIVKEPTCGFDGTTTYTCSVCGDTYTETIPATGEHTYFTDCDRVCEICGLETRDVDHTVIYVEAMAPTCTETGNIEYWYCSVCGMAWLDADGTLNTNLMAVKLGATCATNAIHNEGIEAGCHYIGRVENWYCAACDVYYLDAACTMITNYASCTIPALQDSAEYVPAKDATCFEDGNVEYWICYECEQVWADAALTQLTNIKNVQIGMAHGEIVAVAAKDASCYEDGNLAYWYCVDCGPDCGYIFLDEALTMLAHLEHVTIPMGHGEITHVEAKDATCYENGNIEYWYCAACGQAWLDAACTLNTNLKAVILPIMEHTYVPNVIDPGCENDGCTVYVCSRCGDNYVTDKTPALGHNFNSVVTIAPTCVEWGLLTHTCLTCDYNYDESIPPTGEHTYDNDYDATCNVCGEKREIPYIPGDLNDDGKVNIRDLGLLQQKLNGWNVTIHEAAADTNNDGKINIRDLGLLQQYLNGWNVQLGA